MQSVNTFCSHCGQALGPLPAADGLCPHCGRAPGDDDAPSLFPMPPTDRRILTSDSGRPALRPMRRSELPPLSVPILRPVQPPVAEPGPPPATSAPRPRAATAPPAPPVASSARLPEVELSQELAAAPPRDPARRRKLLLIAGVAVLALVAAVGVHRYGSRLLHRFAPGDAALESSEATAAPSAVAHGKKGKGHVPAATAGDSMKTEPTTPTGPAAARSTAGRPIVVSIKSAQALPGAHAAVVFGELRNQSKFAQGNIELAVSLTRDDRPLARRTFFCCDDIPLSDAERIANEPSNAHFQAIRPEASRTTVAPGEVRPFTAIFTGTAVESAGTADGRLGGEARVISTSARVSPEDDP